MAFPNRAHRRVNYGYLARLDEALEALGHSTGEIPVKTLRSPWPDIKEYIENNLKLRVCGWCKLPKPQEQMAPTSSMCLEHFEKLQNSKGERLNMQGRTRDSIRSHKKSSKFVEAMQDQLRRANEPETDFVGPSIAEPTRKPAAWDILDRADTRSTRDVDTKKDQV